jgi:hypothetical protein
VTTFGGETFRADFREHGIAHVRVRTSKSELYEQFEPLLTAGEVELLDVPELQEQLLTLVWRGTKIDHLPGDHDDFANAAAGALVLVKAKHQPMVIGDAVFERLAREGRYTNMKAFH